MIERSLIEPETALEHVRWVRELARGLVADEHLAEDLAQDTLVAALERSRSGRPTPRGWLVTVLRNFLRQAARGGAHRRARELAAALPEARDPSDRIVAEIEAHQRLMQAVLELDEAQRDVIVLRFLRGLPPREIARELGLDAATVSNRITAGLRRLRARLERDFDDRSAWMGWILPLAFAPERSSLLGILAVKSKLIAALSLCFAGSVAYLVWSRASEPRASEDALARSAAPDAPAPAGATSSDFVAPDVERVGVADAARAGATKESAAAPQPAPKTYTVRGRVYDGSGQALPGLRVGPEDSRESAASAANGWFELTSSSERAAIVSHDPAWITVFSGVFRADSGIAPIVVAAPRIALAGEVVDAGGNALRGARVSLATPYGFETRFPDNLEGTHDVGWRADCDAGGKFELVGAPSIEGARLRVVLDGYEPHQQDAPSADARDLRIVLQRPSVAPTGSLAGVVLDTSRRPIAKARVALGLASVLSDGDGRFSIDLRRAVTTDALRVVKEGFLPSVVERPYEPRDGDGGWPSEVEVVLGGPPLAIAGRVVDAQGEPVANARVSLFDATPFGLIGMMPATLESLASGADVPPEALESTRNQPAEDGDHFWDFYTRPTRPTALWNYVRTDGDGEFELGGLAPRTYRLRVLDDDSLVQFTSDPISAGSRDIEVRMPLPERWSELSGRVVGPDGRGVAGVHLELTVEAYGVRSRVWGGSVYVTLRQPGQETTTDAEGRFTLRDVAKGDLRANLTGEGIVPSEFELARIGDPSKVEIPVDVRCSFEVTLAAPVDRADAIRALDGDGEPLDLLRIRERSINAYTEMPLVEGRSGVVGVSSQARTLVLFLQDIEVARLPIRLAAGEPTQVRW